MFYLHTHTRAFAHTHTHTHTHTHIQQQQTVLMPCNSVFTFFWQFLSVSLTLGDPISLPSPLTSSVIHCFVGGGKIMKYFISCFLFFHLFAHFLKTDLSLLAERMVNHKVRANWQIEPINKVKYDYDCHYYVHSLHMPTLILIFQHCLKKNIRDRGIGLSWYS